MLVLLLLVEDIFCNKRDLEISVSLQPKLRIQTLKLRRATEG